MSLGFFRYSKWTYGLFSSHQFETVEIGQTGSDFSSSQSFGPVALSPFFVDLSLGPRFLECGLTSAVWNLDQEFGQIESLNVQWSTSDSSCWSFNQSGGGIDHIKNGNQFTLVWTIGNKGNTANLYEFCISLFIIDNYIRNLEINRFIWSKSIRLGIARNLADILPKPIQRNESIK